MTRFRTRREAASYLTEERGCPTAWTTLQKKATTGGGPPYRIFGNRALYTDEDLDAWAEARMSPLRSSTSEYAELELTYAEDQPKPPTESTARASGEPKNQQCPT